VLASRPPLRWPAAQIEQRFSSDPKRGFEAGCQERVAGVEVLPDGQHDRRVVVVVGRFVLAGAVGGADGT
jgi:hypothetical protein